MSTGICGEAKMSAEKDKKSRNQPKKTLRQSGSCVKSLALQEHPDTYIDLKAEVS